jgi:hypothetical protein
VNRLSLPGGSLERLDRVPEENIPRVSNKRRDKRRDGTDALRRPVEKCRVQTRSDVQTRSRNGRKVRTGRIAKPREGTHSPPLLRFKGVPDGEDREIPVLPPTPGSVTEQIVRFPIKRTSFSEGLPSRKNHPLSGSQFVRNRVVRHFPTSYTIRVIPRFCQANTGKDTARNVWPGCRVPVKEEQTTERKGARMQSRREKNPPISLRPCAFALNQFENPFHLSGNDCAFV